MKSLNFNMFTIGTGIYFIVVGIIYYLIFNKHHKRNKVEMFEVIKLVTKFYVLITISIGIIFFGIKIIIDTNAYKETRSDVVSGLFLGIIVISSSIINFIFYIKRSLKDFNNEIREKQKKRDLKIGEILELIFFIIFLFTPIWSIPYFINVFDNRNLFIISLIKTLIVACFSAFLLYMLNPLDIKNRMKRKFIKKES